MLIRGIWDTLAVADAVAARFFNPLPEGPVRGGDGSYTEYDSYTDSPMCEDDEYHTD